MRFRLRRISEMVPALTPFRSGCCCRIRKSSSSADGVLSKTSSAVTCRKPLRIWNRSLTASTVCVRAAENGLLELLQDHLVEPAQVHDRAVVALHELLDRQHVGGILVAKQLGDTRSDDRTAGDLHGAR